MVNLSVDVGNYSSLFKEGEILGPELKKGGKIK